MTILLGCLIVNTTSLYPHWSRWPSISCGHAWRCLTTWSTSALQMIPSMGLCGFCWPHNWFCPDDLSDISRRALSADVLSEPDDPACLLARFFWMMVVQLHCMTVGRVCLASYSIVCKSESPQSVHSNLKQINLLLALCGEGLFVCWFK